MLSLLNPILDASHTRNMKLSPPNSQCLPGTRTEVIGDIWAWATSDRLDARPHMLWVFGYAGCGKSAVAHEVAKILADENRLAACFVFSRGSGDRSSSARLATTIASQIASAIPELEPIIESTVRRNPGLLSNDTTSLSAQFKHLVYLPIQAIASKCSAPFIIVLDGVDECYDRDDVSTLIEDMIQFFDRHPNIPVRFLITSRVEDHLYQILHSSGQVQLLNLVEKTSDADIAAALTVAIQKEARGQVLSCHGPWPSASDTAKLVKHIGGSFIFMTTILKVLFDRSLRDGLTPMERLPLLLGMYPDFDELYREILEPWQYLPHFGDIISTIVLAFRPLSIAVLSEILNIKTYNVTNVLIHLHAIIQVPGDDRTPITLWHTSLRDYLCAEGRSGSLFVEPSYHRRLAQRCISLASISVNRKDLSSSEYARRYAIKHLATLVETTELDPELLHEDLCRAMRLLEIPVYDKCFGDSLSCQHWRLVRALINAGADVNSRFNEPTHGIMCALHSACYNEELELVYFLLERGADPNIVGPEKGFTGIPLGLAARQNDVKLAARLLACGADPNLQGLVGHSKVDDNEGFYFKLVSSLGGFHGTALQEACLYRSLDVVNFLLDHGADPTLTGGFYNRSALQECAWQGYDDCARALLMHEAGPNIQDNDGNTPLHNACAQGHVEAVECLLAFKADARIKNNKGRTALGEAQDGKQDEVLQVLLWHGVVD